MMTAAELAELLTPQIRPDGPYSFPAVCPWCGDDDPSGPSLAAAA